MEQRNGRVYNLLDRNEEIEERAELGTNEVVVTSRRVLALNSSDDDGRYRAVERASVTDVDAETEGENGYLKKAGIVGAFAAVPLALDIYIDFDELLSFSRSDVPGNAAELVDWILLIFTAIDLSLTIMWALSVFVALAYAAKYLRSRSQVVRIAVIDDPDMLIPAGENPPLERLTAAITSKPLADQSVGTAASASPADQPAGTASSRATDDRSDAVSASEPAGGGSADPFAAEQTDETVEDLFAPESPVGQPADEIPPEMSDETVEELFDSETSDEQSADPFESS